MTIHPIRVVNDVIDEYKSYLRTEFRARDEALRAALERELETPRFIAQDPFFQAHRPFKDGAAWRELGLDARLADVMGERTGQTHAFLHQSDAIRHLLTPSAAPLVVTTGTGSGKSECFLLPVLQNAIEDAKYKRSGLTALLVYPMNALANDQQERIAEYLEKSGHSYVKVARYDRSTPRADRERLRDSPPHILLTNYMMLEYLLVRPADREGIFANHRCRYLVLDEVHSYRGSLGANIALLVRRVGAHLARARQDWNPDDRSDRRYPKLVYIGTSATIRSVDERGRPADEVVALRDQAVRQFFSTLTGVPEATIRVLGESLRDLEIPPETRWSPTPAIDAPLDPSDADAVRRAVAALAGLPASTPLADAAGRAAILYTLGDLLARRPLSVAQIVEHITGQIPARHGAAANAVRREVEGALVAGAALPDKTPGALRLRTHRFVRGGWRFHRCVDPTCGRVHPMGQDSCSCGKRTAPLYLCRACGADALLFRGDIDAPSQLDPGGEQAGEWTLYNLDRISEIEGMEDIELHTDRQIKRRPTREGSFDPGTCLFSDFPRHYPVRCVLAPARTVCLVCGGTAGSRNILTPVALGTSAAVRVLAEGVLEGLAREHALEAPDPEHKERLLIFADSRQDAAHQARFITFAGRYDRMRRHLLDLLAEGPKSLENVIHGLYVRGVRERDNPHTRKFSDAQYVNTQARERAMAWEEAPLLDEIALTAGYRNTVLNLGLVGIRYEKLAHYVQSAGGPLATAFGISVGQFEYLCRCILDEFRRRGALSREMLIYHPLSPNYKEQYKSAEWERRSQQPVGYPYDKDKDVALAAIDREELPPGIDRINFWRRDKAGGAGPGFERLVRRLLKVLGGGEPTRELGLRVVEFLRGGPRLIDVSKLHGHKGSYELLQVSADCVELARPAAHERFRCNVCNVRLAWVVDGAPCPGCRHGTLRRWPEQDVHSNRNVVRLLGPTWLPLVAGEHTAQVTGEEREQLEEDFKGTRTKSPLNILACSPTLEMGIDVGGLDAVLLRNVPPRPDNYAQRGGRAGRRKRVGVVLGYTRNTPHDGYFFDKPGEMIAGEIPAPGLGLTNREVAERHLHAIVFGLAEPGLAGRMVEYIDLQGNLKQDAIDALVRGLEEKFAEATELALDAWSSDLRGPVGLGDQDAILAVLQRLPDKVRDLFARVRRQIVELDKAIDNWRELGRNDFAAINAMNLKRRLLGLRDDTKDRPEADDRGSGHPMRRFAELGILPGYEFPSEPCTVRLLGDSHEEEPISVERRFGLAQYQPDARAHARGHRWRVIGLDLSSPWNPRDPDPWAYAICKTCKLRYANPAEHTACPRCGTQATIVSGMPAYPFGGFLAVRDDTPVLEEEERYAMAALVQPYPQHDGFPLYRYDLPTGWFAELRRNETIRWLNEWKAASEAEKKAAAPTLHGSARGFYLCPHCGRVLKWPTPESDSKKAKRRTKPAKEDQDPFEHGKKCPARGKPPQPCALTTHGPATTLRIFVDLPREWSEGDYCRWGYSLGYALRTGIRLLYMLDGPEIELTLEPLWEHKEAGRTRRRGALSFLDPALGGSGFLDRAAAEMHLVAQRALEHLDHADCETACYRCLKSYTNQRHHEHLDWPRILPELEQLAAEPPSLTSKQTFDPQPWLDAYDAGVGSPLELAFLHVFERHGIAVDKQVPLGPDGAAEPISLADFVIVGTRTAIYIDGAAFHRGHRLRRDRVIRTKLAEGPNPWRIIVFTKRDLADERAVIAALRERQGEHQ